MASPMSERAPWWTYMVIFSGAAWCGAVLSQVFLGSEHVRWASAAAMSPALIAWSLDTWSTWAGRVRLQLGLLLAWLAVLFTCVAFALAGRVEFSDGGRWKRALAALALVATVVELRRLWRLRAR